MAKGIATLKVSKARSHGHARAYFESIKQKAGKKALGLARSCFTLLPEKFWRKSPYSAADFLLTR